MGEAVKEDVGEPVDVVVPCDNNSYDGMPDDNSGDNNGDDHYNSDHDNNDHAGGESEVTVDEVD